MGKDKSVAVVKNNFNYYQEMGSAEKQLSASVIYISQRSNQVHYDKGEVPLESTFPQKLTLEVEASNATSRDFKFKIYERNFMQRPCYRFDSDGDPHNNLGDIPLPERQVTTPHFHKFDRNGIEIAYKTPSLEGNEELNRKAGLEIFAAEENIVCGSIPEIRREDELIPPEDVIVDPLQGESFDE